MITGGGRSRAHAREVTSYLSSLSARQLGLRQDAAERAIVEMGITFTIYSEGQNIDRAWPLDIIPRTLSATEWRRVEEGLRQRLTEVLGVAPAPVWEAEETLRIPGIRITQAPT